MYKSNIISMQNLIENFISINLKNEVILLQLIINEAASISIFKWKSCEKFKKWWYERLITLKKNDDNSQKFYKRYYSNFNFDNFKKIRNKYFHDIQKIKKSCWIEFLENAINKKFFLIYKFIKNNKIEKLFSINHNKKICIDFNQKCNAFINVMFLFFWKIQKNSTDHFIIYEFSVEKWMSSWLILIESKISSTIFTSVFKKTSKSNNLIFLIIQKTYKIISKLFFMIFSCLINNKTYLNCWRIDTETILKKMKKSNYFISKSDCLIRNLHAVQPGQCFFMKVANIWSRLLKHNWWNLLYEKVCTYSNVFFDFTFNEDSLCTIISIVRRPNFSSCMRMISNHDFYFIVVNRFLSFWTAKDRSYRNHHQSISKKVVTSSKFKKNQNTIEKNEFYEWKIWRTTMKTMNENSFICIKINN